MLHRNDGILRFRLNYLHEVGDFTRGLRGTFRQLSDLIGHDGEPRASLSGSCRLDSGV